MAKNPAYDYYCADCPFHTPHEKPYKQFYTRHSGKRAVKISEVDTLSFHRAETGHVNFKRKVAPGI